MDVNNIARQAVYQANQANAAAIVGEENTVIFVFPDGTTRRLKLPRYLAMPRGDVSTTIAEVEHDGLRASIVVNPY